MGHVSCRSPAFSGISLSRFAACLPRLRQTQGNCFAESTVIKGRHSRFCHSVAGMPRRNVMADGKRLNPQLSDAEVETQMQLLQLAPRVPNFGGPGRRLGGPPSFPAARSATLACNRCLAMRLRISKLMERWNAHAPWARTAVDLVAAAGVSAVAIARAVCRFRYVINFGAGAISTPSWWHLASSAGC